MTWLSLSILAALVSGASNVCDKLLLRRRGFAEPWTYMFWPAIAGFLAIVLVAFGASVLPLTPLLAALAAGALFILAAYFMIAALRDGEASVALPIIGGLAPIATYVFGVLILGSGLGAADMIGFVLIVLGCVLLLGVQDARMRLRNGALGFASAVLFGLSNVLKKYAFAHGSLLTGLMWISMGGAMLALASLAVPAVRRHLSFTIYQSEAASKTLYFANRLLALLGTLLVSVAIARGHPALVDVVQNVKYIVIFFGGWLLLKEEFSGAALFRKLVATSLIFGGLGWLGLASYARSIPVDPNRPITWGVTFSQKFSRQLGLDWQKNFTAILDELQPRKIRLVVYWDESEQMRGRHDFSAADWMLQQVEKKPVEVIFVLGMKAPRWPECHLPDWARALSPPEREEALHQYVAAVITRYRGNAAIKMWQLENEPFFAFGTGCPSRPGGFFEKELTFVRSRDPSRPILVTDAGEFGLWYGAARAGDVFGSSLYREVYPPSVGRLTGVIHYPLDPSFFRLKQKAVRWLAGIPDKRFIVAELQAEPWGGVEIHGLSYEEQMRLFSPDSFDNTIRFARDAGFDEYYLWGAEWWYWVREKQGSAQYWNTAKEVLNH